MSDKRRIGGVNIDRNVKKIKLNNMGIYILKDLGKFPNATHLDLSQNRLELLPEDIDNLTNLKELNVYDNKLKAIPQTVGKLDNLEILRIPGNQIKELPEFLAKMKNLKKIYATQNKDLKVPAILILSNIEIYTDTITLNRTTTFDVKKQVRNQRTKKQKSQTTSNDDSMKDKIKQLERQLEAQIEISKHQEEDYNILGEAHQNLLDDYEILNNDYQNLKQNPQTTSGDDSMKDKIKQLERQLEAQIDISKYQEEDYRVISTNHLNLLSDYEILNNDYQNLKQNPPKLETIYEEEEDEYYEDYEQLLSYTVYELRQMCRDRNITYRNLSKRDMVSKLADYNRKLKRDTKTKYDNAKRQPITNLHKQLYKLSDENSVVNSAFRLLNGLTLNMVTNMFKYELNEDERINDYPLEYWENRCICKSLLGNVHRQLLREDYQLKSIDNDNDWDIIKEN